MTKKTKIAVIFGGKSTEYEISLRSVEFVLNSLNKDRYDIVKIGITKGGRWLLYNGNIKKIIEDRWESEIGNKSVFISPNFNTEKSIVVLDDSGYTYLDVDVVFPVLHGQNGEDGTVQGIFELANIPFVGCGVLASAICMDKVVTHAVLDAAKIKTAKYLPLYEKELKNLEKARDLVEQTLDYPVYVKPSRQGSSIGISKASSGEELISALEFAKKYDDRIVVQKAITGQEIEVAVIGNSDPVASDVGEIKTSAGFYDYESKYKDDTATLVIPANIKENTAKKVKEIAVEAYRKMDCKGLARVDFFVTEDEEIILNEINTLPGFTSISMYPRLLIHGGMTDEDLVDNLIKLALEGKKPNDTE